MILSGTARSWHAPSGFGSFKHIERQREKYDLGGVENEAHFVCTAHTDDSECRFFMAKQERFNNVKVFMYTNFASLPWKTQ